MECLFLFSRAVECSFLPNRLLATIREHPLHGANVCPWKELIRVVDDLQGQLAQPAMTSASPYFLLNRNVIDIRFGGEQTALYEPKATAENSSKICNFDLHAREMPILDIRVSAVSFGRC